jgi:perosamine synthetase
MNKRPIQISEPDIGEEELLAVVEPLRSGWVTQGPKVAEFENGFANYHLVDHALAVTSCTTGLHLALSALEIGPGDEVILPVFTWIATANVVLYTGATPVFVDVDPESYNIDIEQLVKKVSSKTKAIIAVHLFGLCVDVPRIRGLIPNNIAIIEDAACAAGATFKETPAGGLGDIGVFSFHPRKTITTGEGGMVTTNSAELAEKMTKMRNHGAEVSEEQRHSGPKPYLLPDFKMLGFNYRMTDLQGAVGCVQLGRLRSNIQERRDCANFYHDELADLSWLKLPVSPVEAGHGWQAFVTRVDSSSSPVSRNLLMERLQARGVATRPGTHSIHMLTYYKNLLGFIDDDFPVAKSLHNETMAIPLHNRMTNSDYAFVVDAIHSSIKS